MVPQHIVQRKTGSLIYATSLGGAREPDEFLPACLRLDWTGEKKMLPIETSLMTEKKPLDKTPGTTEVGIKSARGIDNYIQVEKRSSPIRIP